MNDAQKPRPARPLRTKMNVDQRGDSLRLRYRHREWGGVCFTILWLIGWTVCCVFLAGMVIRDPKPVHILFAVPFWASWFFVFTRLMNMLFQREEFSQVCHWAPPVFFRSNQRQDLINRGLWNEWFLFFLHPKNYRSYFALAKPVALGDGAHLEVAAGAGNYE